MKTTILSMCALSLMLVTSCDNRTNSNMDNVKNETLAQESDYGMDGADSDMSSMSTKGMMEKDGIKISVYDKSPKFDAAKLSTTNPKNGDKLKAGKVEFKYDVQGYELGAQTSDAGANGLANSDKGQHIHAILNNEPYMAEYKPGFEKDLSDGRYILLSFLSRSYHEGVKNPAASDILQFMVGDTDEEMADLNAPHIFYSRPKGEYAGADAKKLLLDFYLVNCNLSADGYMVRATLNGTEFMLDKWAAYIVEGLPMGDLKVKLELLDSAGNLVPSPYNPSERTVTLKG